MKVLCTCVYRRVVHYLYINDHRWHKSLPVADNKHCYELTNKCNFWTIVSLTKQLIVSIFKSLWKKFIHTYLQLAFLTTSGVSLVTDGTKTENGRNTICITDSAKSLFICAQTKVIRPTAMQKQRYQAIYVATESSKLWVGLCSVRGHWCRFSVDLWHFLVVL